MKFNISYIPYYRQQKDTTIFFVVVVPEEVGKESLKCLKMFICIDKIC